MDWISITTGCFAVSNAIAKSSRPLHGFVREVRESRSELDAISRELHSLESVVDLLKDDTTALSPELAAQTPVVLEHCLTIVDELGNYMTMLNDSGLSRPDKKFRWIATRKQMAQLRMTLEEYTSTLGLALDVVGLTTLRADMEAETGSAGEEATIESLTSDPHVRDEVARVVTEIGQLTARLRAESQKNDALLSLRYFLDTLQAHADVAAVQFGARQVKPRHSGSSVGDDPDSAIEMSCEPAFIASNRMSRHVSLPIEDIDEFLDELRELPSRAPTPPPKALSRMSSVRSSVVSPLPGRPDTADSDCSPVIRLRPVASPVADRPYSAVSEYNPVVRLRLDAPASVPGRLSSLDASSASPSISGTHTSQSLFTTVTKINSDCADTTGTPAPKTTTSRIGRLLGHMRTRSDSLKDAPATPDRPATSRDQTGLARRGSQRLSIAFRRLPRWKAGTAATAEDEEDEDGNGAPDAVFGVSLKKSMQVAKETAKTHHSGGSGSSRREFPLCVFKCCAFLRERGTEAPDVFGEGGDPQLVQKLRKVFSTGPDYGASVDWGDFGVYEVADLVLLFLSQLPRPLIPEPVAKRWISLSKQATMPGTHAIRLEQCIDFWEEALGGVRGPARSLFKLLLNLWGDIADAADRNDMTAERLAGAVVKPLMHSPAGKYDTDFMLGLAFLIRKRSEYSMLLRGGGGKSNAAF